MATPTTKKVHFELPGHLRTSPELMRLFALWNEVFDAVVEHARETKKKAKEHLSVHEKFHVTEVYNFEIYWRIAEMYDRVTAAYEECRDATTVYLKDLRQQELTKTKSTDVEKNRKISKDTQEEIERRLAVLKTKLVAAYTMNAGFMGQQLKDKIRDAKIVYPNNLADLDVLEKHCATEDKNWAVRLRFAYPGKAGELDELLAQLEHLKKTC